MKTSFLLPALFSFLSVCVNSRPEYERHKLAKRQSIKAASPFDHSWVGTLTAIGDSYSAGLGAGHAVKAGNNFAVNTDCYQYSYGYPNLLNANDMIGENSQRRMQFLSCSGALVPSITKDQVPKMQNSQVITVSAGGNDANLADILNYCVYMWLTRWFRSCEDALKDSQNAINADKYTTDLNDLMKAVSGKLIDANSRIYWVGYEQFWDTTTNDCDKVTWSFTRNYGFRQYLTQDRRKKMNALVDLVNTKISDACKKTDRCVFVDPTADINRLGGHYCEPGVDEKYWGGSGGWNREETWFYEWSTTKDNDADWQSSIDQPQKRSDAPGNYNNDTFEGRMANYIAAGKQDNDIDPAADIQDVSAQGLPDSIGRVFHLDKFANGVVALRILDAMNTEQAKMMNQPLVTKTIGCKATGAASALSAPASSSAPPPTTTKAAPAPPSSSAARKCDIDCGSELPPKGAPIRCTCFCNDGTLFIMIGNKECK